MKKKMIFSMLGATAILLTACSKEQQIPVGPDPALPANSVMFSIGLPSGEPVTYAQVHEQDEYAINSLDIFEFDDAGKLVKIFKDIATTAAPDGDFVARKTVAQIELDKGTKGKHDFLFVANLGKTTNNWMQKQLRDLPLQTTTKDAFKAELTKALASTDAEIKPDFVMTGNKEVTINGSAPMDLTQQVSDIVMLTRDVARLDIAQRLKTSTETLTITKVEVRNAPSLTSLFPVTGNLSPASETSVSYKVKSAGELTAHLDAVATAQYTSRYKKLFYLYERAQSQFTAKGTPTVYISADYVPATGGAAVKMRYEIPFDRNLTRNYLYTIVLGVEPKGDTYEATANIMTLKWEDEHKITQPLKALLNFTANTALAAEFTYDNAKHEMTLKSGDAKTLTDAFTVASEYAGDDIPTFVAITAPGTAGVADPNNSWITVTPTAGKITIAVKENNEGAERAGIIWLRSAKDVQGNQLYSMKIIQPKK
ncbi:fimbrial protein [Porphyromonas pogonae]|uniref:fimbrial protein n=1 Tax=Porphyromonas pogonae TaxID=867595 RepID=UPI002E78917A|nr:fimbrial protein [Porphyromonas pogonae]